jgi:hypothetical protein
MRAPCSWWCVGGFVSGLGGTASFGGYIWGVFFGLSVTTLPAAIGIAILKYRLYDIDLVINRTLVYDPLTATLVALYFGDIVVLQRFFSYSPASSPPWRSLPLLS